MNKKHGFTISELLISIAIISIVSAMGMTIAKRGTDDAYKNYFSVGTINLNNALAQIESGDINFTLAIGGGNANSCRRLIQRTEFIRDQDGIAIRDSHGNLISQKMPADPSNDIFNAGIYYYYSRADNPNFVSANANQDCSDMRGPMWLVNNLRYLFDDTDFLKQTNNPSCNGDFNNDAEENCRINASNGITYEIIEIGRFNPRFDVGNPERREQENYLRIMMTVPAPRTRQNPTGRARTEFLYCRNANAAERNNGGLDDIDNLANSHMLIPLDHSTLNNRADLQNIPYVNLQDREDLLMAYIDDGVVGRHVPDNGNNTDRFMPIRYGTFRDALNTINNMPKPYQINNETVVNFNQYIDANNIQHDAAIDLHVNNNSPTSGTIKFASPRKLK